MADLVRQLDFPLEVEFVRLSSYGSGQQTPGKVKVVQGLKLDVRGRHVLVVEDIVDTGITLAFLMDYLKKKKPASLQALRADGQAVAAAGAGTDRLYRYDRARQIHRGLRNGL